MNRKGEERLLLELVVALVLLGLFVASVMTFLAGSGQGESYFSKFYASDVASSAQIVAGANGDVVLRYDNLNPTLPLAFFLDNGRVAVGAPLAGNLELPSADEAFYGRASSYPTGPVVYVRPTYLAIRKVGNSFAITDVESLLRACPMPAKRALTQSTTIAYVEPEGFSGAQRDALRVAFRSAVQNLRIAVTENSDEATLNIRLKVEKGDAASISAIATNTDSAAIACLAAEQIAAVANLPLQHPQTSSEAEGASPVVVDLVLVVPEDRQPTPQQLATALSLAIARYLR